MAYYSGKDKWKRRALTALAVSLCATLSLGIFAACGDQSTPSDETEEEETTTRTDTQKIRNGNFEFYDEMDEETKDKRDLIASPSNWTFSSGSPSSDTKSGIVDLTEWNTLSASGSAFFQGLTDESDFASVLPDAVAHWEDDDVTVYDRLRFYDLFEDEIDDLDEDSDEAELFADYTYSIDFEDVEYLSELETAPTVREKGEDAENKDENAVLMIHNHRTSDGVLGTGQSYSSGTTVTLDAGTSAKLSVWVRTDNLAYGYEDKTSSPRSGAYIKVTQTVGGSTLDEMRIENIRTEGAWKEYTVYLRANSYAETTFSVALGLGGGSTDDRFESLNGFAFFDDLTCTILPNSAFPETLGDSYTADLNSKADAKVFDDAALSAKAGEDYARTFALDLYMPLHAVTSDAAEIAFGVTKETSGSREYESKLKSNIGDPAVPEERQSIIGMMTYGDVKATANLYLKNIYENDFKGGFPFVNADGTDNDGAQVLLLMSTNGAAYTAKYSAAAAGTTDGVDFTLAPDEYVLFSFRAKTSAIESGTTGASVTLVDGENRTAIEAFDTTSAATVDIENETTDAYDTEDIYNGWVQCFFYVANETDSDKTFSLEFNYGPTAVSTAEESAYASGYAAFADFEISAMTRSQYGYAASGDYAAKVSLTGEVDSDSQFDAASAVWNIEKGFSQPTSFRGVQAGSSGTQKPSQDALAEQGVYTGMLNAKYAQNYLKKADDAAIAAFRKVTGTDASYASAEDWWKAAFGSGTQGGRVANQPLAIINSGEAAAPSYGYRLYTQKSVSANSTQRISVRVKLSENAKATVYLIDTSDPEEAARGTTKTLMPTLPAVTYWYDDQGNIVAGDPSAEDFNAREDTLYYLAENGLYYKAGTRADDPNVTFYANLHNYERDEEENYVTDDGTIAFYFHDGKTYAYRTETSTGTYTYSQPVENLPTKEGETSIVRYDYASKLDEAAYGTAITVQGSADNKGWTDVVFYVKTGNEAKSYSVEVWAGDRTNATDGLPAGSYVFFDDHASADASSDYEALLEDAVTDLEEGGSLDGDKLNANVALYYTYTFYDAADYLRYDVNEDEDGLGNPYGSYKQSAYEEGIAWLKNGTTLFLDYGTTDVTVEADDLTGGDDQTTDDDASATTDTNFWLVLSSGILAVVLLFAVVAIIVRRVLAKRKKHVKVRPAKPAKAKPVKPAEEAEEAPAAPEAEDAPEDGTPYND